MPANTKTAVPTVDTQISDNLPSASRVFESLRHVGYKTEVAVCDIIDNSIDAKASRIWVTIDKDSELDGYSIQFADDGTGMSHTELEQALRLGSEGIKYSEASLGKFGFGLITASISTCRRVEVITRAEGASKVLFSAQDLDAISRENSFIKEGPRLATAKEIDILNHFCDDNDSGTVVIWRKCDLIKDPDKKRLLNTLRNQISQTFRFFLSIPDNLEITINGESVIPADFLLEQADGSEIFSDDFYSIKTRNENGSCEHLVRCRLAVLPYEGKDLAQSARITYDRSGFSIFRNFRQIASGQTLGMFTKHQLMNYFRGEIFFPSSLDEQLGINFAKMSFHISRSILDQLEAALRPQIATIRRKIHLKMRESASRKKEETDFSAIEQYIRQRASVLVKPKREMEKRIRDLATEKSPKGKQGTDGVSGRIRTKLSKKEIVKSLESVCKFILVPLGIRGPIYETSIRGKRLEIEINTDHPFYDRFVLSTHQENIDIYNGVGFLLYAMASAEKVVMDDEVEIVMQTWKSIMAANLAILLTN